MGGGVVDVVVAVVAVTADPAASRHWVEYGVSVRSDCNRDLHNGETKMDNEMITILEYPPASLSQTGGSRLVSHSHH